MDSLEVINDVAPMIPSWAQFIVVIISTLGGKELVSMYLNRNKESDAAHKEERKEIVDNLNIRIKVLEASLESQRKEFEEQLRIQRKDFDEELKLQRDTEISLRDEIRKLAEEAAGLRMKVEMLLEYVNNTLKD